MLTLMQQQQYQMSNNKWQPLLQVFSIRYFLQPREPRGEPREEPGSVRLRIHYTPDHVFPADTYRELRDLLLHSADSQVCFHGSN